MPVDDTDVSRGPTRAPQRSRRTMQHLAIELEIKAVARSQLSQDGVHQVTLRAIAREMGITAPALYRYFPSLDDLITSMCQDIAHETAESISAAIEATDGNSSLALHVAIRTFRIWAMNHPNEFMLMLRKDEALNGDDHKPGQFAALFFGLYLRLWATRPFEVPELTATAAATSTGLLPFANACIEVEGPRDSSPLPMTPPPAALFVFARTWARLYGIICMEVSGQLTMMFGDVTPYFESELDDAVHALGVDYIPLPCEAYSGHGYNNSNLSVTT